MTKKQLWLFTIIFLFIIYLVPVTQTFYELRHNENGRIQMLDLLEDLFITPKAKHKADVQTASELSLLADTLSALAVKGSSDSSLINDPSEAERLIDECRIKVRLLRNSVHDYNRHVKGDNNHFLSEDTVKPYYRTLRAMTKKLTVLDEALQGGDLTVLVSETKALAVSAVELKGLQGNGGIVGLTLTALRRIMVGDKYLRPYEKEMENSSLYALAARPWSLFTYYTLFEDLGDKGVLGENKWLFYRPDVEYVTKRHVLAKESRETDPNDAPIKENLIDSIVAFKDALKAKNIDMIIILMPTKPSIYPDLLNKSASPALSGTFSHTLSIIDSLKKRGVDAVDLFSVFAEERKRDQEAGDSIYMRTDTHFKGRAVLATAKTVADHIRKYPWYQDGSVNYVFDTTSVVRLGDISDMTKLPSMAIRDLKFSFPAETVTCYPVWKVTGDSSAMEKQPYKDDYQASQVLVLGDSYSRIYQTDEPRSAGWISHLAKELKQPVASIVSDGGASTMVREVLVRKLNVLKGKKVVVWEIVERDIRFGEKGWRNIALVKPEDNE
ncbi:MAG: hypothetical protein JNL74_08690 [Fibrobacteres bacterium]|nr:hypothetical protein [Fibrobacterota bacterium]